MKSSIIVIASMILFGPAQRPANPYVLREFIVTSYCEKSCCCGPDACGITASGMPVRYYTAFCAAPRSIPFDTQIEIPGYFGRPVRVLDRGGAIKGNRLDVFFHDKDGKTGHQRAREWGVRKLVCKVYR